mmetsp:Transcript_60900/g.174603  ORF Transcript_60900/g.174603 Transcript_60900/m.174603 type:complete len:216 (-) Transcript_60900:1398-2045(-)
MSTHQYSRSSILILGSRKPKIALISNTSCSASTAGRSSDSSSESSSWPTNGSSDGSALSRSSASSASSSEKRTPAVADERAPTEAWEPLRAEGSDRIMPSCAACRKEVGKSVSSPNDPRPEPPRPQWPPSAPWPWPWPGPWPSPWPSPPWPWFRSGFWPWRQSSALSSALLYFSSPSFSSAMTLSKSRAIGWAIGQKRNCNVPTKGTKADAMLNW